MLKTAQFGIDQISNIKHQTSQFVLQFGWSQTHYTIFSQWLNILSILPANICWFSRRLQDVFKTYLQEVFKKSWRQTKCLLGISVSNKSKSVSDKSISHISISDKSRRIQNVLISTQYFWYSFDSDFETQAVFLF